MKTSRGLTLSEVIVAGTILFGVTAMLALIFSSSYAAFRRGTSRMSTTQRAREVVRRLMPIVMSAVAPDPTLEAIYYPPTDGGLPADSGHADYPFNEGVEMRIHSADDILAPMAPVNPRNPSIHQFRTYLTANGDVRIERISETLDPRVHYKSPLGVAGSDSKVIATRVKELAFEHLDLGLVKVTVTTTEQIRNAAGNPEDLDVVRTRVISVPYYSAAR